MVNFSIWTFGGPVEPAVKKFTRLFNASVRGEVRRHEHFMSRGERARRKSRIARKKARRAAERVELLAERAREARVRW